MQGWDIGDFKSPRYEYDELSSSIIKNFPLSRKEILEAERAAKSLSIELIDELGDAGVSERCSGCHQAQRFADVSSLFCPSCRFSLLEVGTQLLKSHAEVARHRLRYAVMQHVQGHALS